MFENEDFTGSIGRKNAANTGDLASCGIIGQRAGADLSADPGVLLVGRSWGRPGYAPSEAATAVDSRALAPFSEGPGSVPLGAAIVYCPLATFVTSPSSTSRRISV